MTKRTKTRLLRRTTQLEKWELPTTLFRDDRDPAGPIDFSLHRQFESLIDSEEVRWSVRYRLMKRLGAGSQGVVFLAERTGAYNISLPVALKVFSPSNHADLKSYRRHMERLARVAMRLALIQQDHLLDMHNVVQCRGISVHVMEWVDGFDLRYLMSADLFRSVQSRLTLSQLEYLTDVTITEGPECSRLKPGVAIAILRECLAALAAMHRNGLVHADIKPSNIMLKRSGNAKLIDFGCTFELDDHSAPNACTPRYAAVEVLNGERCSPQSDLASLGYCLVELLTGRILFPGLERFGDLISAKQLLPDQLPELLPAEIANDEHVLKLIRGLIAPNPVDRFADAEAADFLDHGAANFQRQLVKGDLSSEYENEIRQWLQEVE